MRTYRSASVPSAGTTEVQTLTIGGTPDGGTFKLAYSGEVTGAITWSATTNTILGNINTALRALTGIGSAGITATAGTLSSGVGTVILTFGGHLASKVVPTITVALNSLTGTSPTLAVAETTPGVDGTARQAPVGSRLVNLATGRYYTNYSTPVASWVIDPIRLSGSGAPTNDSTGLGLCVIGDTYVRTSNGVLYVCTATNLTSTIAWALVGDQTAS